MKTTSWKEIAELIGVTAIVLSLIFVGLQIRQSEQVAVEEIVNNSNERQNAIRELMLANADVWHRACLGEPLEPVERIIAAKIYGAWMDHVLGEYILRSDGVYRSEIARQIIVEEVAAQHQLYPGLKILGQGRREWHQGLVETSSNQGDEDRERFMTRARELESRDVAPSEDTAWCGRT